MDEIAVFADVEVGLSPEHGWGVERRLEWAAEIEERTRTGSEAARLWSEAIASIRDPLECPAYAELTLEPQLGLLPIGRDPRSGLWEFAHPLSGQPPARNDEGELEVTEDTGIVFVLIPGGTFTMGAQSTNPQGPHYDPLANSLVNAAHEVLLTPFFISKYEMTRGQWVRCAGDDPSYDQFTNADISETPLHPANQMSWLEANELLQRMGLVLPSEAQWERAARGGTTTAWWTGDKKDTLVGSANLADRTALANGNHHWPAILHWPELDDGYGDAAPVNVLAANPFGLHHVHGNVWEWCRDGGDDITFYDNGPLVNPVCPVGPHRGRRFRGGSFYMTSDHARSAARDGDWEGHTNFDLGVRPAREIL